MKKYFCDNQNTLSTAELAKLVGVNESIILQKIHSLTQESDGYKTMIRLNERWLRMSYEGLKETLPFFSIKTLKRTIKKLEADKFLLSDNLNDRPMDRTKWYTVNYSFIKER